MLCPTPFLAAFEVVEEKQDKPSCITQLFVIMTENSKEALERSSGFWRVHPRSGASIDLSVFRRLDGAVESLSGEGALSESRRGSDCALLSDFRI